MTTTTTNAATNELINRLLPPVVAVVSSAGADKIAATAATATNAASGFSVAQLLQPFSQLNSGSTMLPFDDHPFPPTNQTTP